MLVIVKAQSKQPCGGKTIHVYRMVYQWPKTYCRTLHEIWGDDSAGHSVINKKPNVIRFPLVTPTHPFVT
ncbi:hypothetical protein LIER_17097 [Lithospermum erythrorhizon]|uniref:Uncharacterized protein n=1 Tax=Lithospermum erythrorhizon TaxID=34254 RepID=A0AAV3QAS8_LITER